MFSPIAHILSFSDSCQILWKQFYIRAHLTIPTAPTPTQHLLLPEQRETANQVSLLLPLFPLDNLARMILKALLDHCTLLLKTFSFLGEILKKQRFLNDLQSFHDLHLTCLPRGPISCSSPPCSPYSNHMEPFTLPWDCQMHFNFKSFALCVFSTQNVLSLNICRLPLFKSIYGHLFHFKEYKTYK